MDEMMDYMDFWHNLCQEDTVKEDDVCEGEQPFFNAGANSPSDYRILVPSFNNFPAEKADYMALALGGEQCTDVVTTLRRSQHHMSFESDGGECHQSALRRTPRIASLRPTTTSYNIRDVPNGPAMDDIGPSTIVVGSVGSSGPASHHSVYSGSYLEESGKEDAGSDPTRGKSPCAVCGDEPAKLHYGVLACYGCKGFFRRTLTGKYRYMCRFGNNCVVDRYQRNSCRSCRFNRCLEIGMDPKAVRDLTGKQRVTRTRKRKVDDEAKLFHPPGEGELPAHMRELLASLMEIESRTAMNDNIRLISSPSTNKSAQQMREMRTGSLRELFVRHGSSNDYLIANLNSPSKVADEREIASAFHRYAIKSSEWVNSLADQLGDDIGVDDKIVMLRACYLPLALFDIATQSAKSSEGVVRLNNHLLLPSDRPISYFPSDFVERTLSELVRPLRSLRAWTQEEVLLKTILILNHNLGALSEHARSVVAALREKVKELMFSVVREMDSSRAVSRFGSLLLLLPTVSEIATKMRSSVEPMLRFSEDNLLLELLVGAVNAESSQDSRGSSNASSAIPPTHPTLPIFTARPQQEESDELIASAGDSGKVELRAPFGLDFDETDDFMIAGSSSSTSSPPPDDNDSAAANYNDAPDDLLLDFIR